MRQKTGKKKNSKAKKIWLGLVIVLCSIILIVFIIPFPGPKRIPTPNVDTDQLKFPQSFFWGASTAAHQVEGGLNNNLTQWEKDNANRLAQEAESKFKDIVPNWDAIKTQAQDPNNYISGNADDQYNLYPQDIELMKQIGLNSYRFSVEWSRIEPHEGQFDAKELAHYQTEIKALKAAGIEPFVTLWHRSQPIWVADQGDWESTATIDSYAKYVDYVVRNLPDVKYWMTFNEPTFHIVAGYINGNLPPQIKSFSRGNVALNNIISAHKKAYQIIHNINPGAQVGSTQAMQLGGGLPNTMANHFLAKYLEGQVNWKFLDGTKDQTDFVGLQYYGPSYYTISIGSKGVSGVKVVSNTRADIRSDMGWEVYPAGIYELLKQTDLRYHKPIIITENGVADASDSLRADFIKNHLYWVHKAISEGVNVQGYFYWSLLDNFEWDKGFWPEFGLIHVDRNTQARTIRPSALEYGNIIKNSAQ